MNNDQWFEPGDKVVRVMSHADVRALFPDIHRLGIKVINGTVYCVSSCWRGRRCNLIGLAGIENSTMPNGKSRGFPAFAFRRVEEIKLCVRAAEHFKTPAEQPATA